MQDVSVYVASHSINCNNKIVTNNLTKNIDSRSSAHSNLPLVNTSPFILTQHPLIGPAGYGCLRVLICCYSV